MGGMGGGMGGGWAVGWAVAWAVGWVAAWAAAWAVVGWAAAWAAVWAAWAGVGNDASHDGHDDARTYDHVLLRRPASWDQRSLMIGMMGGGMGWAAVWAVEWAVAWAVWAVAWAVVCGRFLPTGLPFTTLNAQSDAGLPTRLVSLSTARSAGGLDFARRRREAPDSRRHRQVNDESSRSEGPQAAVD